MMNQTSTLGVAAQPGQPTMTVSLKEQLAEAYRAHADSLPQYGWPSEVDRWIELLVCVIHQTRSAGRIEDVREVLEIWQKLDLISPSKLVAVKAGSEEEVVLLFTLKQEGFNPDEARRAVEAATKSAEAININYKGKVQHCLRAHATTLRDELVLALGNTGLAEDKIRYAVTHWLQNTTNAPISLEHESVLAFCKDNGIDIGALREAADELDINLSQLDDLLNAQVESSVAIGGQR
jgi:hypothetical protein